MTEIPEHLLARSRARRQAAGAGGAEAEAAPTGAEVEPATAGAAPAAATATTPAPATPATAPAPPPPPKPDPPYVRAYKERRKIPYWAMPVLALLPVWAFVYMNTLEEPSRGANDPLTLGAGIFTSAGCATCHGASGEGGVGPAFQNGAVVKTWPNYKDHILWVSLGSSGWSKYSDTYGAAHKPIGNGGMPNFDSSLTPQQIILVVRYEREVLAGAPADPALDALSETAAQGGDVSASLEKQPSADPTQPAPAG